MKKIFLILFILISNLSFAQRDERPMDLDMTFELKKYYALRNYDNYIYKKWPIAYNYFYSDYARKNGLKEYVFKNLKKEIYKKEFYEDGFLTSVIHTPAIKKSEFGMMINKEIVNYISKDKKNIAVTYLRQNDTLFVKRFYYNTNAVLDSVIQFNKLSSGDWTSDKTTYVYNNLGYLSTLLVKYAHGAESKIEFEYKTIAKKDFIISLDKWYNAYIIKNKFIKIEGRHITQLINDGNSEDEQILEINYRFDKEKSEKYIVYLNKKLELAFQSRNIQVDNPWNKIEIYYNNKRGKYSNFKMLTGYYSKTQKVNIGLFYHTKFLSDLKFRHGYIYTWYKNNDNSIEHTSFKKPFQAKKTRIGKFRIEKKVLIINDKNHGI